MEVYLENQKEIICLMPCLHQFEENGLFTQSVVGFTDSELVFYNDYKPDQQILNKGYVYHVKQRMPLKEIKSIADEKIDSFQLSYVNRLHVICNDISSSFYIYYFKKDKKMIKVFLNALMNRGYKVTKTLVKINSVLD